MKRFALVSTVSLVLLLIAGPESAAQVFLSGPEAEAKPDTEIVSEQYLLVGTAIRGCGESQVAVNP